MLEMLFVIKPTYCLQNQSLLPPKTMSKKAQAKYNARAKCWQSSQMQVLNTAQAPQITKLASKVTYLVTPKWKHEYHACKVYSSLNLMFPLVSLSQLNLNSPKKLSNFAMKLEPLRRGKPGWRVFLSILKVIYYKDCKSHFFTGLAYL